MIYLIDRGFRIKSASNIIVNQSKYQGIDNECFRLNCSRGDVNVNVNVNDNDNDLRSSFANNVNDNDNVNVSDNDLRCSFANNDSDILIDKDLRSSFANNNNVNDNNNYNDKVNDNDLRSSFANNDNDNDRGNFIYLFDEKYQRSKSNRNSNSNSISNSPTNNIREAVQQSCFANSPISVNINCDLYSWLNDDDIITEAAFPHNFRCIISGPSECGKTFLLKKTISS